MAEDAAFVPLTRSILAKIGYAVLTEDEVDRAPPALADREPEAWIVDEAWMGRVSDEVDVPLIVVTGPERLVRTDERVFGAVRRPVGAHALFRLLQRALEDHPRACLRAEVDLELWCRAEGEEWTAAVSSLSEAGCMVRGAKPLRLGTVVKVRFDLPGHGSIETRAETAYRMESEVGLVFLDVGLACRAAIRDYVEQRIAAT